MAGETKSKLLNVLRPALSFIPDIAEPEKRLNMKDRLIWTCIVLLVFLVCSQIPLYGILKMNDEDPLFWSRMILASNRGSLMELGVSPIINAGMIMQLLAGTKIISLDQNNKEDKDLYHATEKVLALLIGFFEAVAYVWSGMYGDIDRIGVVSAILLILQLTFASVLVQMLDQIISKGYGVGSAISLFIATNVCEDILWKTFAPIHTRGQYEGAIVELITGFFSSEKSFFFNLKNAFYRDTHANIINILSTVLIFLVVNFFQGFQLNIAIHNAKIRGHSGSYPIKLFYTSNIPIILQSALISNLFFASRVLYKKFGSFFLVRLFGRWKEASVGGASYPVSGLIYYISPPTSLGAMLTDPLHGLIYIIFTLVICSLFSKAWIEVSGSGPKEVCDSLKSQDIVAYGGTDKLLKKKLQKYIPTAAALGGVCVGILTILADFLGAIGSGTGILLACNIVFEVYEEYVREKRRGE